MLKAALAHHRANRLAEAEVYYRQLRPVAARSYDVWHLSGILAHQQGRTAEAVDFLTRAARIDARGGLAEMWLAVVLLESKRLAESEAILRRLVTAKPTFSEAWDHLATCLRAQDRLLEAIACHERVVQLKPEHPLGWVSFGNSLRLAVRLPDALRCHERALALDPRCAPARFGRAQVLQQLHQAAEAIAEYDRFLELNPKSHEARSNRLLAMHHLGHVTPAEMFAAHVEYGKFLGPAARPAFATQPESGRRLRLAILSPDLRTHSCAYFLEPMLRHLDPTGFELYLYHDHFREDAMSERLRSFAAVWRNFSGVPDREVERIVRQDAPDVLIDIAGHTGLTNRLPLLNRKLAPVQITYLGYPNTTGVDGIDFRFTDAHADPLGQGDRWATEKLVRFSPTAWSYQPPTDSPDVAPAPCVARGTVTFGCFNDLGKLTDRMFAVWGRILGAVPGSRLKLKGHGLGDAAARTRFLARLEQAGIAADRVELLERTPDTRSHLACYGDVDVALDTFPYHGTTTTCEALWMGVPVVSLEGETHMSRVGVSLLAAAGHPEWLAADEEQYVRRACELAADPGRLSTIRQSLRSDLAAGPLFDHAGQAARFGAAIRECWTTWCRKVARPVEVAELSAC